MRGGARTSPSAGCATSRVRAASAGRIPRSTRLGVRSERVAIGRSCSALNRARALSRLRGRRGNRVRTGSLACRRRAAQRQRGMPSPARAPRPCRPRSRRKSRSATSRRARRSMKRVSMRRPSENSFHSRVPRGNSHASGCEASMKLPRGSAASGAWSRRPTTVGTAERTGGCRHGPAWSNPVRKARSGSSASAAQSLDARARRREPARPRAGGLGGSGGRQHLEASSGTRRCLRRVRKAGRRPAARGSHRYPSASSAGRCAARAPGTSERALCCAPAR